jgi:hypothetical protein
VKTCSKCGEHKVTSEFPSGRAQCRSCRNTYCKQYYSSNLGYWRELYKGLRLEALSHYSNGNLCCALCSEPTYEFLVLDHEAGNGAGVRDRKARGTGVSFLRSLRGSGYPKGLRVLCHNCNHLVRVESWKQGFQKAYYHSLRLEVLSHYSPELKCACCGYIEMRALTIDHIHGGGGQHRRTVTGNGQGQLRWLKINSYPDGYRVLCHNCNHVRSQIGYCPHETQLSRVE